MRRMRKQPVAAYNEWDMAREPGDRVFARRDDAAIIYDIRESTGQNKAAAGDLTPHEVKKNGIARRAVMADNGIWYWDD